MRRKFGTVLVAVADLRPTNEHQDPTVIERYRRMIRAGISFAPIFITRDKAIVDGHHRWRACVLEGVKFIAARYWLKPL